MAACPLRAWPPSATPGPRLPALPATAGCASPRTRQSQAPPPPPKCSQSILWAKQELRSDMCKKHVPSFRGGGGGGRDVVKHAETWSFLKDQVRSPIEIPRRQAQKSVGFSHEAFSQMGLSTSHRPIFRRRRCTHKHTSPHLRRGVMKRKGLAPQLPLFLSPLFFQKTASFGGSL